MLQQQREVGGSGGSALCRLRQGSCSNRINIGKQFWIDRVSGSREPPGGGRDSASMTPCRLQQLDKREERVRREEKRPVWVGHLTQSVKKGWKDRIDRLTQSVGS